MSGYHLPSFVEIPRMAAGCQHDEPALLRMCLLPCDDTLLRAAAIELYTAEEDLNNEVPTADGCYGNKVMALHRGLASVSAITPGGIAWKLSKALDFFAGDEDYQWWRQLLVSALSDAIELERARQAGERAPRSAS